MKKLVLLLLNNIVVNRFLILIKQDDFIKRYINNWSRVKVNKNKTLQENVGFSHSEKVNVAVKLIHDYVQETEKKYLKSSAKILDIGCGVGLYLKDFAAKELYGTDLSSDFLAECKQLIPQAKLFQGDYLKINFEKSSFDLIYSISVIEYISPSKIQSFFNKVYSEMKPGGILLIQYPHALKTFDKWYADLSYISYTPDKIEQLIKEKFKILVHEHSYDKRKVSGVDKISHSKKNEKSFCNGMILIAQKNT